MQRATDREINAAKRVVEAVVEFLIAWDEGRRLRTPEPARPQFEVKLPEFPTAPVPNPEPTSDRKSPVADPGQLIGVDKVAELLECSPRTIYRLADCGRLDCAKMASRGIFLCIEEPAAVAYVKRPIDTGSAAFCTEAADGHPRQWPCSGSGAEVARGNGSSNLVQGPGRAFWLSL